MKEGITGREGSMSGSASGWPIIENARGYIN